MVWKQAKNVSPPKSQNGEKSFLICNATAVLMSCRMSDDGKGIDPEQIRAKAIALKFPWSDTSTPEQLLSVICQPGFSFKGQMSDVSGRVLN